MKTILFLLLFTSACLSQQKAKITIDFEWEDYEQVQKVFEEIRETFEVHHLLSKSHLELLNDSCKTYYEIISYDGLPDTSQEKTQKIKSYKE